MKSMILKRRIVCWQLIAASLIAWMTLNIFDMGVRVGVNMPQKRIQK